MRLCLMPSCTIRGRNPADAIDRERIGLLPDQPRHLRPRQPGGLAQEPPHQPLAAPVQPPVVELDQHPPHEVAPRAAVDPGEVHARAALDEGAHLFQALPGVDLREGDAGVGVVGVRGGDD